MEITFNEHNVFIDDVSPPKRKNLKRKILTSRLSKIEIFSLYHEKFYFYMCEVSGIDLLPFLYFIRVPMWDMNIVSMSPLCRWNKRDKISVDKKIFCYHRQTMKTKNDEKCWKWFPRKYTILRSPTLFKEEEIV